VQFNAVSGLDQWFSTFFVQRPIIALAPHYNPMTPSKTRMKQM